MHKGGEVAFLQHAGVDSTTSLQGDSRFPKTNQDWVRDGWWVPPFFLCMQPVDLCSVQVCMHRYTAFGALD